MVWKLTLMVVSLEQELASSSRILGVGHGHSLGTLFSSLEIVYA